MNSIIEQQMQDAANSEILAGDKITTIKNEKFFEQCASERQRALDIHCGANLSVPEEA